MAGAAAACLHAAALAVLLAVAALSPPPEPEDVIPVQLLREAVTPPGEPAPAPKALAERRSLDFRPSAQTVTPQVVNPTVVAPAAPAVAAERLDLDTPQVSAAPREISRSAAPVEAVRAVTSVAAPVAPTPVDVSAVAGPALRGPIEVAAPVGPSVGPRPVASGGPSLGTGPAVVDGGGSSVREGVLSTRDVLGSPDGPRLANVNTRVGTGHLRGRGGAGTTLGGVAPDCERRPEVRAYLAQIRDRTIARWAAQGTPPGSATLRFKLDAGGSTSSVELVNADNDQVGVSVVDALRAASPFPPMSDAVRCLANDRLIARFSLTTEAVAN